MSDTEGEAVHVTTDEFAAYVDGTVSTDERVRIDGHLASCLSCAKELLALSRLTKRSATRRYIKVVLPAAAAAAIVLFLVNPPSTIAPANPILRDAADVTETTVPVEVVTPASGQQINRDELRFIWRSLGNQTNYRFTLTTAEGEGIWITDTADTTLAVPPTLSMEPNLSYIWYVDALLLDGTAATSGIRRFTLTR